MKIRLDFVSNSSSSSFMVVGMQFTWDELVEFAERNKLVSKYYSSDEAYSEWDSYDIINELKKKFPELEFWNGKENYYEEYCIGIGYGGMKPDETKTEFEARIAKQLSKLTGKEIEKVSCLVDGGRDS